MLNTIISPLLAPRRVREGAGRGGGVERSDCSAKAQRCKTQSHVCMIALDFQRDETIKYLLKRITACKITCDSNVECGSKSRPHAQAPYQIPNWQAVNRSF